MNTLSCLTRFNERCVDTTTNSRGHSKSENSMEKHYEGEYINSARAVYMIWC